MIYAAATVPVNPDGEPPLTREQAWRGLTLKARDARPFLPEGLCTRCEVMTEGDGYIIREATILGDDLTEFISFEPMRKVSFHQVRGPREGVIVNELFEDESGQLQLRFYGLLGLRDRPPGGPEEQAEQRQLESDDKGYKAALLSTLARTRDFVRAGRIEP